MLSICKKAAAKAQLQRMSKLPLFATALFSAIGNKQTLPEPILVNTPTRSYWVYTDVEKKFNVLMIFYEKDFIEDPDCYVTERSPTFLINSYLLKPRRAGGWGTAREFLFNVDDDDDDVCYEEVEYKGIAPDSARLLQR
jgi:hypothetical protein